MGTNLTAKNARITSVPARSNTQSTERPVSDTERVLRWSRWNVGRRLRYAEYDLNLDLQEIETILGRRAALHNKNRKVAFKHARQFYTDEKLPELHLQEDVISWSENNEGACLYDALEKFGLPLDELRKLLGKRAGLHPPKSKPRRKQRAPKTKMAKTARNKMKITEQALVILETDSMNAPVLRYILETGSFDHASYEEWSGSSLAPPTNSLINLHGTWNQVLLSNSIYVSKADLDSNWLTEEFAYASIRDAIRMSNKPVGIDEYTEWTKKNAVRPAWWEIVASVKKPWKQILEEVATQIKDGRPSMVERREVSDKCWETLREAHQRSWQELVHQFSIYSPEDLSQEAFDAYYFNGFRPTAKQISKQVGRRWNSILWLSGIRSSEIRREYSVFAGLDFTEQNPALPDRLAGYDTEIKNTEFCGSEEQYILRAGRAGLLTAADTSIRNRAAIAQYCNGAALREIGKNLGITGETVRQIILFYSYADTEEIRSARRCERDTIQTYVQGIEGSILRAWSKENFGISLKGPCEALGISSTTASKYLGNRAEFHNQRSLSTYSEV